MKASYLQIETRYNIVAAITFERAGKELSRETKVKLMNLRIKLGKHVKRFRKEMQEAANDLMKGEYTSLKERVNAWNEEDRTDEEKELHEADKDKLGKLERKLNADLDALAIVKYGEKTAIEDIRFSPDEFVDIMDINSSGDVTFPNGTTIKTGQLMEAFYELFAQGNK